MKAKEIIFSVLDLCKAAGSDDAYITEELVLFLCKKYRAFLIKKEQEKEKANADIASEFEYQEICLDLEKVAAMDGSPCTGGYYLRSTKSIPKILEGTTPRVYTMDFYQSTNISFVPKDKMRYVGNNQYLQNIIYSSLGTDFHLYLNSSNPQFGYLKKIRMNAIFEDPEEAAKLACPTEEGDEPQSCDPFEQEFPIREYLVPMLIELVAKQVSGGLYRPVDTKNENRDTLSDMNVKA